MSGKKRRRDKRSATSQTGGDKHQATTKQGTRSLALVSIAVAGAAVVIMLAVVLTPAEQTEDGKGRPAAVTPPDRPAESVRIESDLVLPTTPQTLDIKAVQGELVDLASELIATHPNDTNALLVAGLAYSELQQSQRAVELLSQCVQQSPEQAEAYVTLAQNLTLLGADTEAIDVLRQCMECGKSQPQVVKDLAEALAIVGKLEDAEHVLVAGTAAYPADAQIWLQLGRTQVERQQFADAEVNIRRAMELGESGVPALIALSTSLLRQGKRDEALEVRKQVAELSAQETRQSGPAAGQFQTGFAERFLRQAVQVFNVGAKVYLDQQQPARAEPLLMRSLELDPQQVQSLLMLRSVCRAQERLPDVIVLQQRLIELQPTTIVHFTNLASVAVQLGDNRLAEDALKRAVEQETRGGIAHFAMGLFYLSQSREAESLEFARTAAARLQNVDAYLLLASAWRANGDLAAARQAFSKARQAAPADPRVQVSPF